MQETVRLPIRRMLLAPFLTIALATAALAGQTPLGSHRLEGIVRTTETSVPLGGAEVHLVELGRTTATREDGRFVFSNLPHGTFTLGAHLNGFASIHRRVSVPGESSLVIELQPDVHFDDEVTVTAAPWAVNSLETPQLVDVLDAEEVQRAGVVSIGDALAEVPGLANISTGDALGTPVIRGLSENRIRVLHDGIPLSHQQFSFRHSPNVDPTLAQRIEVVRGPASVLYGPEAMGGVINVVQAPLPTAHDAAPSLHGRVGLGYTSNTGTVPALLELQGAAGGLGFSLAAAYRDAGDVETPDGKLDNTDYRQANLTGSAGYSGSWGRLRLRWHHWEDDQGFFRPQGFRIDLEDDLFAGDLYLPTRAGELEVLLGHQTNVRRAFPEVLQGRAAVDLKLLTRTARVGLRHRPWGRLEGRVAAEVVDMENTPRALGELLPEHASRNLAAMVFEELRLWPDADGENERLILSFGARWDSQSLDVQPDLSRDLPQGFSADYDSFSSSLGAVLRLGRSLSLAANLGRGWRPPNAFELFANGVHGGVAAVQLGNRDLVEESNLNSELSLRYASGHVKAEITGFRNDFKDYIYLADSGDAQDTPDGVLPVFLYRQTDALFDGLEAQVEAVPIHGLTVTAGYSRVDTRNESTGRRLPLTPPDRWRLALRLDGHRLGAFDAPYLGVEGVWNADGDISGPDEPFGRATDSYFIVHLRTGMRISFASQILQVDLEVRNLFDEEYTDFLYTYKAFAPNPGRDVRLLTRWTF